MWVAVGQGADSFKTILHSSDGITWTESSGVGFDAGGYGVAYNPVDKMWVAVGASADEDSGTILHSSDGITWSKSSSEGAAFSTAGGGGGYGWGVAYNPVDKMWVAVGQSATDSYGTILHSSDGITWTASSSEGGGVAFLAGDGFGGFGVAYNPVNKMWVAVGRSAATDSYGTILHSSDGITWSESSSEGGGVAFSAGAYAGGQGVAYNPVDKMWVAVGQSFTDTHKTILHSSDGITWSKSSSEGGGVAFKVGDGFGGSGGGWGVAYNPVDKMWVAVGRSTDDSYGTILHSSDGITWSESSSEGGGVAFKEGACAAYNPIDKMWVAVGNTAETTDNSGTILHSSDGITWTASSEEGGGVAFNAVGGGGNGVAYTPGLVVPIGELNRLTV